MPDTLDLDTLTTKAAEAAGQGDAVAAAALLRRALDLQVSSLGPDHRDLAPTLNNLAMMLERQGDAVDAERCYRRAYDVARRGAGPDDALVQMSRANLVAFLQASGIADPVVDEPGAGGPIADPPTPASVARTAPPVVPPAQITAPPTPRREPPRTTSAPAPGEAPSRGPTTALPTPAPAKARTPLAATGSNRGRRFALAIAAGAVVGGLAGWLLIARQEPDTAGEAQPTSATVPVAPTNPPARPDEPKGPPAGATASSAASSNPQELPPASRSVEPAPAPPRVAPPDQAVAGAAGRRAETAPISVDGRICTTLARGGGVWRCEPAGDSTTADAVYYYSRVRSGRDLVVGHRWTHQGTVVRTVTLEVRANPQEGFRTFSRQSLAGRNGAWEVSLIAPDGTVVDRQEFRVTDR